MRYILTHLIRAIFTGVQTPLLDFEWFTRPTGYCVTLRNKQAAYQKKAEALLSAEKRLFPFFGNQHSKIAKFHQTSSFWRKMAFLRQQTTKHHQKGFWHQKYLSAFFWTDEIELWAEEKQGVQWVCARASLHVQVHVRPLHPAISCACMFFPFTVKCMHFFVCGTKWSSFPDARAHSMLHTTFWFHFACLCKGRPSTFAAVWLLREARDVRCF